MPTSTEIKRYTEKLEAKYKRLTEKAYSYKFTDNALSSIASFKANRLLKKIHRIKFGN